MAAMALRAACVFLEDMQCAILSSSRIKPPKGLHGGGDGEVGSTYVRRLSGEMEKTQTLR